MPTRLPASVAVLALAALALTGCTDAGSAEPKGTHCASAAAEGPVADSVKVTGKADSEPTVSFDSPLKVTATQRHVVTRGSGRATKPGDIMELEFAVYNGTTGESATSTGFSGHALPVSSDANKSLPGLAKTIACAKIGSRIVGVLPPKEAFGPSGDPRFGIGATDTVVFVVDVVDALPDKATGAAQPAPAGFPTVADAADGRPKVTFADDAKAPAQTMIGLLKQGTGATVKTGDALYVQYQGINFRTRKIFQESWGSGPVELSTTGVIPGFAKALVGQKVGSQVIVMIPPADGYGAEGSPEVGIKGTDTIVFVIDILAVAPAAQ
jgi:peptidylprolyl isomerase